jgi:DNA-binding NarL/FixJ family response regulator
MISVILADEHEVVRSGLTAIFKDSQDIIVRAGAANIDDLANMLFFGIDDILIIELVTMKHDGIDAIRKIRRKYNRIKILVLTSDRGFEMADRALKAGAKGYITKDSSASQIVDAVRNLARGRRPISEHISEKLIFDFVNDDKPEAHRSLTAREMDVFLRIARGGSCTEIARYLSLSAKTISTHKSRIMDKLNFSSTSDLIQYAIAHKLINGYMI